MYEQEILAYRYACSTFLSGCSLQNLRAYARKIGVDHPTEKKKKPLIDEIVQVLSGERVPLPQSNRGAPVKNDNVDPRILEEIERLQEKYNVPKKFVLEGEGTQQEQKNTYNFIEQLKAFESQREDFIFHDSGELPSAPQIAEGEFEGQVLKEGDIAYLLPKSGRTSRKESILIPDDLVYRYALREGDVVCCNARKINQSYLATKIITLTSSDPTVLKNFDFNDAEIQYPYERIRFYEEKFTDQSQSMKFVQWLVPIRKGQRGCVVSAPKAGKSTFLYDMAKAARLCNRDVWVFVLLLDQSPESVAQFRKGLEGIDFVYTTYEDESEQQVFAANFLLERAKRYAESGKDVLFLVDSFNALARAYNELDISAGGKTLVGGMESKTLYYLKKFLGSARNLKESGSLTMLGALTKDTGNPVDDLLVTELCSVSNLEIHLSEELALCHIYPNIDLAKTRSVDARYPNEQEEDNYMLCNYLRHEYLPLYPLETLSSIVQKAKTYEEVYNKAMKAVREAKKSGTA